jgi:hypothetical protein
MLCTLARFTSKNLAVGLIVLVTNQLLVHAQSLVIPKFSEETISAGIETRFENSDDEFLVGGGVATFNCDDMVCFRE